MGKIRRILQAQKARHSLRSLGLALCFLLLACLCFPGIGKLSLFFLLPMSQLLSRSFFTYLWSRQEIQEEKEFASFLAYLAGGVATGRNLELCLIQAKAEFCTELEEKSRVRKAISDLSINLYAGLELSLALDMFGKEFQQREIKVFARTLAYLETWGARYDIYLQLQRDKVNKLLEVKAEIRSQQATANTEALLMSLMPFVISLLMSRTPYLLASQELEIFPHLQASLLFLSCVGFSFALKLLAQGLKPPEIKLPKLLTLARQPNLLRTFQVKTGQVFGRIYGLNRQKEITKLLAYLLGQQDSLWTRFIWSKALLALAGLFSTLLLGLAWGLCLACLLFFWPDAQLKEKEKSLRQAEIEEYPLFLNLLSVLLASGLSCDQTLRLALLALAEKSKPGKFKLLHHDLEQIRQDLEAGYSSDQALSRLAQASFHAENSQTLHLITRFARQGSEEQINMIKLQAMRSTDNYRNAMRESLSSKSLKLLLPMTYDLVLVILIAALPAIIQIRS